MRKIVGSFGIALFLCTLCFTKTGIVGKISPADGADIIWALGERDSLKVIPTDGQFSFEVRPGAYRIMVKGRAPYKDVQMDNVVVKQEETVDLGEIIMKQ